MSQTYQYQTKDVCSQSVTIEYEGDIVKKVTFVRGCPGNTQGVGRLCAGRSFDELLELLEGIACPGSRTKKTSCPDQLCKAIREIQSAK